MSRTRTFGIGLLVAAGAGIALWSSCGSTHKEPSNLDAPGAATEPATAPPHGTPAGSASAAGATLPGADDATADADSAAGGAPRPHADAGSAPEERSGSSIVRAVSSNDPRDLSLLSRIERELGTDPPPEVHALVASRKQGASRDELTRKARELPDLRLRVLVLRWVDEVLAPPGAPSPPAAPASGSAKPLLKPVKPAG
jgi:hypothetical protein